MALRIAGKKEEAPKVNAAPVEEAPEESGPPVDEMPQDMPPAAPEVPQDVPQMSQDMQQGGGVDPVIAGYRPPEMGPFMCGNCVYFLQNACEIVAGPIDQMGVCNLFTPAQQQEQPEEMPMEGAPEEMPMEAPPEELENEASITA